MNNLGSRLAELDRVPEAVSAFEEAVTLCRRLVRHNETAFLPRLATVLNNHGNVLARTSRPDEALASTQESAAIYGRLSHVRPGTYTPHLARVSLNLGNRLTELGRREEARRSYAETLAARRQLAATNPAAHAQELAQALVAAARFHAADESEVAEARAAADEAIEILIGLPATVTTERDLARARAVRPGSGS
jgi:tetratricopeptide (TPR) repeat protein